VGMYVAFARYVPNPFSGAAQVIMAADGAARFFHPQLPWHELLPGPRVVHVLPWDHWTIFRAGREALCRLLKFVLDEPSETVAGHQEHLTDKVLGTASPSKAAAHNVE